MDEFRGGDEIQPGLNITTDEQIDEWVKQNVESAYHPSCTCKMGADNDPLAVLNERCQVRGIQGLRVVDSSIFPTIPNGNLNAPTIMVAERAADMILDNALETSNNVPVGLHRTGKRCNECIRQKEISIRSHKMKKSVIITRNSTCLR